MHAKLLQSCLTLCDPMDCSLPGFCVHGSLPRYVGSKAFHGNFQNRAVQLSSYPRVRACLMQQVNVKVQALSPPAWLPWEGSCNWPGGQQATPMTPAQTQLPRVSVPQTPTLGLPSLPLGELGSRPLSSTRASPAGSHQKAGPGTQVLSALGRR